MLKLELRPSSLANKLLFWMVSRIVVLAAFFLALLFTSFVVSVALLVLYVLATVGYYFSVHRLALAVFTIACESSGGAARRAPAAAPAPAEVE